MFVPALAGIAGGEVCDDVRIAVAGVAITAAVFVSYVVALMVLARRRTMR